MLGISLAERDFWSVVRTKMRGLVQGECSSPKEIEELHAGLFVLQRLFQNHDPSARLALCAECLRDSEEGYHDHGGDEEDEEYDEDEDSEDERPQAMRRRGRRGGHRRRGGGGPHVELQCDRENLLDSVARTILALDRSELRSEHLSVSFSREVGVDAGGLKRNFFSEFAHQLADNEPRLWQLTGRGALQPTAEVVSSGLSHGSGLSTDALYRACGRVFGMAVLQECKLGRQLSRSFVRLLVGDAPGSLADLQGELNHEAGESEPDFRGSRQILERPLAECGLEGALKLTRSISNRPELGEVELVPGGAGIEVTDENKEEWLTALLRHKLVTAQSMAAVAFRDGIIDVFGGTGQTCPLLCLLSPDELIDLWGGRGVERGDVARLRGVAQVSRVVERQAEWLWQVLEEDYDDELRGQVLRFVTGSSRMGREGVQSFSIEPGDGGDDRLPTAMTCANMLQLPRYTSRAVLERRLRVAAQSCGSFQLM